MALRTVRRAAIVLRHASGRPQLGGRLERAGARTASRRGGPPGRQGAEMVKRRRVGFAGNGWPRPAAVIGTLALVGSLGASSALAVPTLVNSVGGSFSFIGG